MAQKKLKLRPEVEAFAQLMEKVLRRNDHKGNSWKDDTSMDLVVRLIEETSELVKSFRPRERRAGKSFNGKWLQIAGYLLDQAGLALQSINAAPTRGSVMETMDIANFCLFIVDSFGGLKIDGAKSTKEA